jgi:hypothetical protein
MHLNRLSLLSLGSLALTATLTAQSPVVINEVYYDGPGGDDGQVFVELFGPAGFDIGDWIIRGVEGAGTSAGNCQGTTTDFFQFPTGYLIPADGFVVIADGDADGGTTSVANADFVDQDMDMENGADAVVLIDNNGRVVDAVAYGAIDTSVVPGACTGGPWFEGTPARDVFAPLSLERCPAGSDTNDNDVDFTPNVPTPGFGEACCTAIEWVNQGAGTFLSATAGESVGLDMWFSPCGGGQIYVTLVAITDPAAVPPPAPFPVYDATTELWLGASLGGTPPFIAFAGILPADGRNIGNTRLDFTGVGGIVPVQFDIFVGAATLGPALAIDSTNSVQITLQP